MKNTGHLWLPIAFFVVAGCVGPASTGSHVSVRRTSPDASFAKVTLPDIGVTVERPYSSADRTLNGPIIQLNSVVRSSSYIGDTQYLTTITIDKYSEAEWDRQVQRYNQLRSGTPKSDLKTFQDWFYSQPETASMRERDGFRYYLRVMKDPRIGVIEIRGEHNCFQREYVEQDDTVIRRIIDSVRFCPEITITTEQSAAPRPSAPAGPSEGAR